jgi:hypothetical protein
MAGMVPKYVAQLVILETETNGDLVAALERLMKADGSAVSRADVLRQALAPGLARLEKRYADKGLPEVVQDVANVRQTKARLRASQG